LGIDDQTVLDAVHAFNAKGLACLQKQSSHAHRTRLVVGPEQAERLRALLHRSPGDFDNPTSVWTLALAAEVSVAEGIVSPRVSGETIRHTLLRLGITWERAKHWITSPDPAYTPKKRAA
jgi:transposase